MLGEDIKVSYQDLYSEFEYSLLEQERSASSDVREAYLIDPLGFRVADSLRSLAASASSNNHQCDSTNCRATR